jgi:hypothetical protein
MAVSIPIRIPMTWPYDPRSADSTRDPKRLNVMDEHVGNKIKTLKRPGYGLAYSLGAGTGQGLTSYNGSFYAVLNDTFVSVAANPNSGTTAVNFTQSAVPPWSGRYLCAAVVFKNRMWIMAGVGATPSPAADVWSSTDGITWVPASGSAPWAGRQAFSACVLGEKMFVMGGFSPAIGIFYNDVWSTENGTEWELVHALIDPALSPSPIWAARSSFGLVATSSGMFVIGGTSNFFAAFDDVWYSANGLDWSRIGGPFGWGTRTLMGCLYFQNKIWLIGGLNLAGAAQNDVWSSPNGLIWTQTTAAAFSSARYSTACCVYNNKMWSIGGIAAAAVTTDVYSSDLTGTTWSLVTSTPGFTARNGSNLLVFRTPTSVNTYRYPSMWMLAGNTNAGLNNEVWGGNLDTAVGTSIALAPTVTLQRYQFNSFQTGTRLLIKNQSNLWVYDSGNITVVTDAGYPTTTVPGIVVLGGFAYVMDPSGLIYNCALDNPYYWPALNVLGADYEDDAGVCLVKYLNYVVAFGTYTTQIFYDAGLATGSPLRSYLNASMKVGCANANTVCQMGATVIWVGQTREGLRQVLIFNGLTPAALSTPAIDKMLSGGIVNDYSALIFNANGHWFYVLNGAVAGGSRALVYDFSVKEWYEWDQTNFAGFNYFSAADLSSQATFLLDAAYGTGKVYATNSTGSQLYDDAGVPFTVELRTAKYDADSKEKKFWGRLDIVGDQNPGILSISYSDDDGQTYTAARTVDMNTARPALFRNGASRRRIFSITQTDSNPMRLEALEQQFESTWISFYSTQRPMGG